MRFWRLTLFFLLAGCVAVGGCAARVTKRSVSYWDGFDTVVTIVGYAQSQAEFDAAAEAAHQELLRLHRVFDRYHAYAGVNGVYALNHAEGASLQVEPEVLELAALCRKMGEAARWRVNPAMGAVLDVWKAYRERGEGVPAQEELRGKAPAADFGQVFLQTPEGMARLSDASARLDFGALAKGYAVEKAAQILKRRMPSFLIDAGGNIRAGSAPMDGRTGWTVALADPSNPAQRIESFRVEGLSVVSSGGYQRYYEADGVRYHHLIDPDTLMPANFHLQTTIITEDSGLADYLSTALFLLPYEEGLRLAESLPGVDVVWVEPDGSLRMTDGARRLILNGD